MPRPDPHETRNQNALTTAEHIERKADATPALKASEVMQACGAHPSQRAGIDRLRADVYDGERWDGQS